MAWARMKTAIVISVGVLLATSTSATFWHFHHQKNSWRNRFDAAYQLKDGEVLRYIPPPYIPERTEYYHTEPILRAQAKAIPKPPDFFVFKQDENEEPRYNGCGFGFKRRPLEQVLNNTFGFNLYEFEEPKALLNLNLDLTGDWTIREGVSQEAILAALEPILLQATGHRILFEKHNVKRDVIVVRGSPKINWLNKIQIYADKPNGSHGRGFGNLQKFLGAVGEQLNIYVVNDAKINPMLGDQFEWYDYPDSNFAHMENQRTNLTGKVLKNLENQTGLTFTHEQRLVNVWFVSEQP